MTVPTRLVRRLLDILGLESKDWPKGDPAVRKAAMALAEWRWQSTLRLERALEAYQTPCDYCNAVPCWSKGADGRPYCDGCLSMIAD